MSAPPDMAAPQSMADRHARTLARLTELSLALAEDLQAAALAAEAPPEKANLAEAFHKVARATRQTIALEAKLARDAERAAAARRAADREARAGALQTRKAQVRAAVERQVFTQLQWREAEVWMADFDERLETEVLDDPFLDEPLEAQIDRLAAELGLKGEVVCDYVPRRLRRRLDSALDLDPPIDWREVDEEAAWDDEDDPDDPPDDAPDDDWPANGRLAPPMDLPSWETG